MKFLGQGFGKPEEDRQRDTQADATELITTARVAKTIRVTIAAITVTLFHPSAH